MIPLEAAIAKGDIIQTMFPIYKLAFQRTRLTRLAAATARRVAISL